MRRVHKLGVAIMAVCLVGLAVDAVAAGKSTEAGGKPQATEPTQARPNVVILATGGTIAGAAAGKSEYGYKAGSFKVEDLIDAVPKVKELASLSGEQVVNIGSQDMNDKVWLKLAKRVNEVASRGDVAGIVITHGTDTMEETAYFLDLVAKTDKPIVLVGSMRPATAISADGPANLYNGVAIAANNGAKGRGVLVSLNDEIHSARNVTKTNTTNVETFESPNRGPVGLVHSGKIDWFERMDKKHGKQTEFSTANLDALPRVDIIYAHANMSPDLIDAAIANGAKGLVIAGVGDGNMTQQAVDRLAAAAQKGIVVVRSTRLPSGTVLRNNEVDDDAKGFVASGEFNPAKSRVLLQLALTKTKDPKQVQRMFNEY
jgi:L-asparaginase